MYTRGIRGATTVAVNAESEIEKATVELLSEMLKLNSVNKEDIAFTCFTMTRDLDACFPAKYARLHLNFDMVPMTCTNELEVKGAIKKCIRVLMVVNTEKSQKEIKHVYLRDAMVLRPDIASNMKK